MMQFRNALFFSSVFSYNVYNIQCHEKVWGCLTSSRCPSISLCPKAEAHSGSVAGQTCPIKHNSNGGLAKKKKVLEWHSQNLDLNQIEILWHGLKWAVYGLKLSNVPELK